MSFRFNVEKTIQAIGAFLRFHGAREMSYLRLIKLLYLADRESLKETGRPITGDRIAAMQHGPVLIGVYDLIKGQHADWPQWAHFFHTNGYRIEMIQEPAVGSLSKYELGKIRELTKRYADKNEWEMVEICHTLEEWKKNDPGKSSKPIPLAHILEAVGRGDDQAAIMQTAADEAAFDSFFGRGAK
jgi:uncharacterized phage-associated protein